MSPVPKWVRAEAGELTEGCYNEVDFQGLQD